jgi:hypothetical protein
MGWMRCRPVPYHGFVKSTFYNITLRCWVGDFSSLLVCIDSTLIRIRDRLKNLYGVAWRPEDSAFFDLVDQQELDPPEASEVYRL